MRQGDRHARGGGKGRPWALHPGLSYVHLTADSDPSSVSNKPCDPGGVISLLCDSVSSSVKWERHWYHFIEARGPGGRIQNVWTKLVQPAAHGPRAAQDGFE